VLGRFARAHPKVRIEACVARSGELRERLELGQLDLALAWDAGDQPLSPYAERVARLPLLWIGPKAPDRIEADWWTQREYRGTGTRQAKSKEPLPLIMLDAPCPLREIVITALDRAGVPWRRAFGSASLAALWAAASAGLGLTVRTPFGLPSHVRIIDRTMLSLPALPQISLVLYRAQAHSEAPVGRLATLLLEAVRQHVQPMAVPMRENPPLETKTKVIRHGNAKLPAPVG
jgi:DNA-binding transcriptional LysR family regulator